jgi:hypothetical protein
MRIISLFAVALLILIAVTGCGGTTEERTLVIGRKDFKDPDAAMEYAGFSMRQPKDALGGMFIFAVATDNKIENSIALFYSNGLTFSATRRPKLGSFEDRIESIKETTIKSGVKPEHLSSLNMPYLIDVAGHQGMNWPHPKRKDSKEPETASLYWYDSGIEYQLSSSDKGFNIDKALQVANSAYR